MEMVTLGKTGITVNKNGFGALPIQRTPVDESVYILQKAFYNGITYFDTARGYDDSEYKLGEAFSHVRDKIYLATKTMAVTGEKFTADLEESLKNLRTDYVDVMQFHNPAFCPKPGDGSGLYEAMLKAKEEGKIRFIGMTNHKLPLALEALDSGLYDTIQFPFSYLASDKDIALVEGCKKAGVGFIAMKGLSGGLITNAAAAYAYMAQFDNVLPIWGIQREWELDEFLAFIPDPPKMDDAMKATIEKDRGELVGEFCRGCGYCLPCPKDIPINFASRMGLVMRRMSPEQYLTPEWQEKMSHVADCIGCNQCVKRCPYELNPPEMIKKNYALYKAYLKD